MVKRASAGIDGMICEMRPCTMCSASRTSTSQRKKTLMSVPPRAVIERTVTMPGTVRMVSSSGRVTVSNCTSMGAMPLSTRTEMRGKSV
jgi:hypothetical protein